MSSSAGCACRGPSTCPVIASCGKPAGHCSSRKHAQGGAVTELQARVSGRIRLFYGIGSVAEGIKDTAFSVFLLFFYNQVLGLSGSLAGLAILIALLFDAVSDPLLGAWSDGLRSRWGRRHPFMLAAALPFGLGLWALFAPPAGLDEPALFAWLVGFSILVRLSLTAYSVPSNAMLPEMTPHYDERTELVALRFLFGWLAGLGIATFGYFALFAMQPGGGDGRLSAEAYARYGATSAVIATLGVLLCTWGTRRLIPELKQRMVERPLRMQTLRQDLRAVFANKAFRMLFAGALCSAAGWGYINATSFYINTYYWGLSSTQIGGLSLSLYLGLFIAFAITPVISRESDKRDAAVRLSLFALLFGPAPILAAMLGWMPPKGSSDLTIALFLHTGLLFVALISVSMLCASMIADITDQNELQTGQRHEGLLAAVMTFVIKATSGLGTLLAGVVLDLIAFPGAVVAPSPGGESPTVAVDASTADALGAVVALLMLGLFALSVWCLSRYPLRRDQHADILVELRRLSSERPVKR
ncbi:MAG: hypothetical protein CMH65_01300 [Nevskiales bacterium]|nr:hypothetical protein [Nevskiales bacterium]